MKELHNYITDKIGHYKSDLRKFKEMNEFDCGYKIFELESKLDELQKIVKIVESKLEVKDPKQEESFLLKAKPKKKYEKYRRYRNYSPIYS